MASGPIGEVPGEVFGGTGSGGTGIATVLGATEPACASVAQAGAVECDCAGCIVTACDVAFVCAREGDVSIEEVRQWG